MPPRRALILGVTGQDGTYLAEFLAVKGYEIYGAARRPCVEGTCHSLTVDVRDTRSVEDAFRAARPDEVYNLAGATSVPETWKDPLGAAEATALGPVRVLESLRRLAPRCRFFQASSAQIFGLPDSATQNESTPIRPVNPYGAAKAYADSMVRAYRSQHGVFACSGILFNHESPRRGPSFVTTLIADGAARVKAGLTDTLELANLAAERDWGFAGDYVEAMWLMLQAPEPDDFVIATGRSRTVAELAEAAFASLGLDWRRHIRERAEGPRPGEAPRSIGDAAKARAVLNWEPRTPFAAMVSLMTQAALARIKG